MSEKICAKYGIDCTKPLTPIMVRDALVQCFSDAHQEILEDMKEFTDFETDEEFQKIKDLQVKTLITKAFDKAKGDFNNPTKESLKKVVMWLKNYAANFRKPEIIEKHAKDMIELIDKLDKNT